MTATWVDDQRVEEFIEKMTQPIADFSTSDDRLAQHWANSREDATWIMTPISVHRDSDTLSRSNWDVISADLLDRFEDSVEVMGSRHWAVGWVDCIAVEIANRDAVEAVLDWIDALEEYPVADDEHYSALEWEELVDWVEQEIPYLLKRFDDDELTYDQWCSGELWIEPTAELVISGLNSYHVEDVSEADLMSRLEEIIEVSRLFDGLVEQFEFNYRPVHRNQRQFSYG